MRGTTTCDKHVLRYTSFCLFNVPQIPSRWNEPHAGTIRTNHIGNILCRRDAFFRPHINSPLQVFEVALQLDIDIGIDSMVCSHLNQAFLKLPTRLCLLRSDVSASKRSADLLTLRIALFLIHFPRSAVRGCPYTRSGAPLRGAVLADNGANFFPSDRNVAFLYFGNAMQQKGA